MVTEDARTRVLNSLKNKIIRDDKFQYIPSEYERDNGFELQVSKDNEDIDRDDLERIIENKSPFLYNRNHYRAEVTHVRDNGYMRFNVSVEVKKCDE